MSIIIPGKPEPLKLSKTQKLHRKIEALERELNSAKCMLWAAIKTTGGRIDIPKKIMEQLDGDNELVSFFDNKEKTTVLQAKMKGEK
jgi:hypothetical protein